MWAIRSRVRRLSATEKVGVLAWLLALGTLRYRIPYGVSHRDEAFYSAMPYSFLIGNRPYLDERAIHQNAGILLLPFYRLYFGRGPAPPTASSCSIATCTSRAWRVLHCWCVACSRGSPTSAALAGQQRW